MKELAFILGAFLCALVIMLDTGAILAYALGFFFIIRFLMEVTKNDATL